VIEDADVGVHPGMDIALERHHDLPGAEPVRVLHAGQWLTSVELPVRLRYGVHVVQGGVTVQHLDGLADLHAEHVRHVAAALLIEQRRRGGNREPEVAEAVLHIDEDVLQCTAISHDERLDSGGHVRLDAVRV
jgi:hypothetical protein